MRNICSSREGGKKSYAGRSGCGRTPRALFDILLSLGLRDALAAPKQIKIVGDEGGVPIDFAFWIQLQQVAENDTRMRLVLHVELNMMMKMMIGGKLQDALDQIAAGIARSF